MFDFDDLEEKEPSKHAAAPEESTEERPLERQRKDTEVLEDEFSLVAAVVNVKSERSGAGSPKKAKIASLVSDDDDEPSFKESLARDRMDTEVLEDDFNMVS